MSKVHRSPCLDSGLGYFCKVKIFISGSSYHCSNLKFGMRIFVFEDNRNIIEMFPKYTGAPTLTNIATVGMEPFRQKTP